MPYRYSKPGHSVSRGIFGSYGEAGWSLYSRSLGRHDNSSSWDHQEKILEATQYFATPKGERGVTYETWQQQQVCPQDEGSLCRLLQPTAAIFPPQDGVMHKPVTREQVHPTVPNALVLGVTQSAADSYLNLC